MADIRDLVQPPRTRGRGRPRHYAPHRRRSIGASPWTLALLVGAALGLWGEPLIREIWDGAGEVTRGEQASGGAITASFGLCHTGAGWNCVVDGDTFHLEGETIRIADIDTPETHPPRCAEEARLGEAATLRLQALLGAGPFTLEREGRDEDRYGRKLRVVVRDGESLGGTLVSEGLARWYGAGRRSWC